MENTSIEKFFIFIEMKALSTVEQKPDRSLCVFNLRLQTKIAPWRCKILALVSLAMLRRIVSNFFDCNRAASAAAVAFQFRRLLD